MSVTADEIQQIIRSLQPIKSCAGDYLLNEYFTESLDMLHLYLVHILNLFFPQRSGPTKGILVPICIRMKLLSWCNGCKLFCKNI